MMFTPERNWPRQRILRSVSGPYAGDGTAWKGKAATVAFPDQDHAHLLSEKVTSLETQLYDYQYNMGLLLIERKEWTSKFEGLILALEEAKEALKHEQAKHKLATDEAERREEKLRNALGVEKLCVQDLDSTLRAMRSEHAEIKVVADSKLAEASDLVASVEERSLDVEAKLRAAEAKLAELSRRSSEMEKKSQEVDSRELAIKKERFSLITDGEALENDLFKQREGLRTRELRLQMDEERMLESKRVINQREQKANDYDKIISKKQKDLEEIQKKIDAANRVLKDKQLNIVLQDGIERVLGENDTTLEEKKQMLALEVDKKWKSLDAELRTKLIDVEKKEAELHHMEEEVSERDQALDKRLGKLKEMEEEFELKREVLEEMEEFIKSGGETVGSEKHQADADKEELLRMKVEIQKVRAENEEQLMKMQEEKERLGINEERSKYFCLQSELEQEIEKCRHQERVVLKEAEDLKQQKENFEKEWELLDEKRGTIEKEEKNLIKEKEIFEKQKISEEERLSDEKQLVWRNIEEEHRALEEAKEAFKATMEQERLAISQTTESDRSQMIQDLEQKRQELKMSIEQTREEMKMQLEESKKVFGEERERDLENINYLREVARREMEEARQERLKIDRERQEIDSSKRHLQEKQIEIRKDIDDLAYLRNRLKGQREQLINEKNHYISFVEKQKTCKNCSETVSRFVPADLQYIQEIEENPDILPPASLVDKYTKELALGAPDRRNSVMSPDGLGSEYPASVGTISWLRKCTSRIFNFSPVKGFELDASRSPGSGGLTTAQKGSDEEGLRRLGSTVNENEIPSSIAEEEARDAHKVKSDTNVKYDGPAKDLAIDQHSTLNSTAEEDYPSSSQTFRRRGRPRLYRTRSMKDVVKDAKILLGEASQLHIMEPPYVNAETSGHGNSESQVATSLGGKTTSESSLKRIRAQTSQTTVSGQEDGDVRSDMAASDPKKQKLDPHVQTAGEHAEKRYNLRRAKASIRAGKAFLDLKNKVGRQPGNVASAGIASEIHGSTNLSQDGTAGSEIHKLGADTGSQAAENIDLVDGGKNAHGSPREDDLGLEDDDDDDDYDYDDDDDDDDWQL